MPVDMLENYCNRFIEKSKSNFMAYEFLKENSCFLDWQIVTVFYSALCLAKAYLYRKGFPINSINNHKVIKSMLGMESLAKADSVLYYYEKLYQLSRDARYSERKMEEKHLKRAIENYNTVKELLEKNYYRN